jgi:hypothetical protein
MYGVQTEYLGASRNPTRRRRLMLLEAHETDIRALDTLSAEWRQLLIECLKNGVNARWDTWLKLAGIPRKALLESLLAWLLSRGWVCVFEEKRSGDWWPYRLEILHADVMKKALGLPTEQGQAQCWQILSMQLQALTVDEAALQPALDSLNNMPVGRAIARGELLLKLCDWQSQGRSGTYRDFALFARDSTKSLTATEWQWLEDYCDLQACRIERHTPLLLLSAGIGLVSERGVLDVHACPDFAALTPASVDALREVQGRVNRWLIVENRTSFERIARQREADEGAVWLPGYPPGWWQKAMARMLALCPAPAAIACDPDPAGIAIALAAGRVWQQAGLDWEPWKMSVGELLGLSARQPLSERDRTQAWDLLQTGLPPVLYELAQTLLERGEKGEQEGFL